MRIDLPRQGESFLEGRGEPIRRSWFQWLRQMWWGGGYANEMPIYSYLWQSSITPDDPTLCLNGAGVDTTNSFYFRLPLNYRAGTPVYFWFEWAPTTNAAGNVYFESLVTFWLCGEDFSGIYVYTNTESTNEDTVLQRIEQEAFEEIDLSKGHNISFTISRMGTDVLDTYGDTIYILGAGITFQIDGSGWETRHP